MGDLYTALDEPHRVLQVESVVTGSDANQYIGLDSQSLKVMTRQGEQQASQALGLVNPGPFVQVGQRGYLADSCLFPRCEILKVTDPVSHAEVAGNNSFVYHLDLGASGKDNVVDAIVAVLGRIVHLRPDGASAVRLVLSEHKNETTDSGVSISRSRGQSYIWVHLSRWGPFPHAAPRAGLVARRRTG